MASSLSAEQALLNKAIKQEKSADGAWGFMGSKQDKYEKAVELYKAAANAYSVKMMQLSDPEAINLAVEQGGSAYESAAKISAEKLEEPRDAANLYQDAFKLYREHNPERAAWAFEEAISRIQLSGDKHGAGSRFETLAQHYQQELGNNQKAMYAYDQAMKNYKAANSLALQNKVQVALADLQALEADYQNAIKNYEEAARNAEKGKSLQYNIKKYLFQAGVCNLATTDMVGTTRKLTEYRAQNNDFAASREFQLLNDLKEAVEQGEQDMFSDKLFQFDQMRKLDKWETTILLRIKEHIQEKEEDFS